MSPSVLFAAEQNCLLCWLSCQVEPGLHEILHDFQVVYEEEMSASLYK